MALVTMKKYFYIYKITNLLTNKEYVGQRKYKFYINPKDDIYWGSGTYIKTSIIKHGIENFKKEILKDNIKCKTAADLYEKIYIKQNNTLWPNGYNLTAGGKGFHSRVSTPENAQIFKNNGFKKGYTPWNKGTSGYTKNQPPCSDNAKQKLREFQLGKSKSEETKNKMRKPKSESHVNSMKQRWKVLKDSGWTMSEDHKQALRKPKTKKRIYISSKIKYIIKCPHCGIEFVKELTIECFNKNNFSKYCTRYCKMNSVEYKEKQKQSGLLAWKRRREK